MARVTEGSEGRGNVRRGKAVLFQGSKAEKAVSTGEQWVRGAESRFKASAVSAMGPTDAVNARRKRDGKEPAPPFHTLAAAAAGRVAARIEERKAERAKDNQAAGVASTGAALPPEYAELAMSLAQFEGDPETQKLIVDKWHANKAKRARAAEAEKKPVTAGAPAK